MKIVHTASGEAYSLKPETKIEVERTNPFFNDYGEQTTPLELPADDRNRRILGFPDMPGRRRKMVPFDVSIQDGAYHARCRQVVLSAQYKGSIATSFYLNDGSLYSRIGQTKLKDIFGDEKVVEVLGIEQGIRFCRELRKNRDKRFACFPVLLEDDSGLSKGFNYKIMNAFGKEEPVGSIELFAWMGDGWGKTYSYADAFNPDAIGSDCDFYNAVTRTEYVNSMAVTLSPGYYISPFIRANYLLRRLFSFFGYGLEEHFFELTEPFAGMVVLNNVIDVLANGYIRYADLVPDVSCRDFLAVWRKKFCCEFIADEATRTVKIVFLRDVLNANAHADLTSCLTEEPEMSFKSAKEYRRIAIGSDRKVASDIGDSYDDLSAMAEANPGAYFDPADGAFYKQGWSGDLSVTDKIGEASQDYNTGGDTETAEIKVPDMMPEFRTLKYTYTDLETQEDVEHVMGTFLFVGSSTTRNSKLVVAGQDNEETSDDAVKTWPMLAFSYLSDGRPEGTISCHDLRKDDRPRIFDYALYYNGDDGIFEKFYREYDDLLRNALHEVKASLLLTDLQKQYLPATAKVTLRGMAFLMNKLKFTLGGPDEPMQSELLTISLTEPVDRAPSVADRFPAMTSDYRWQIRTAMTQVSKADYDGAGVDKDRQFIALFPPAPSAEWVGKKYGLQVSFTSKKVRHSTFFRHSKWEYTRTEVWMECVRK